METLKLKIENSNGEVIIREGKASEPLPVKEPKIISVSGDIHTVANFIKSRSDGFSSQQIDTNKAIIEVNKDARTIVLNLDPENYYGATIIAKLEQSKELSQFGINTTSRYSRKQLLDLIRFNRFLFGDKTQHAQVIAGLQKLRIKSQTEIEQEKDNGGMIKEFTLTVPLFKGFKAEKISIEICFELVNGDVSFWLESIGLKEASEAAIDGIFEEELKSASGFVIINK